MLSSNLFIVTEARKLLLIRVIYYPRILEVNLRQIHQQHLNGLSNKK